MPLFYDTTCRISQHALVMVFDFYTKYLPIGKPGKQVILPCTKVVRKSLGVPCIHEIKERLNNNLPLSVAQFHPHWYLYEPQGLPPIDHRLILLEPKKVERVRGRPIASATRGKRKQHLFQTSTQRELSGFEIELVQEALSQHGHGGYEGQSNRVLLATPQLTADNETDGAANSGIFEDQEDQGVEPSCLSPDILAEAAAQQATATRQSTRHIRQFQDDSYLYY
jgi:hypothetical protein